MPLLHHARTYAAMLAAFLLLDAIWLGFAARDFYQQRLSDFLGPVNWGAAVVFYPLFVTGIQFFAVRPARSLGNAAGLGALYGLYTYATYDLTNLATLSGWPVAVVVVDVLWGSVLCALTALAGRYVAER